MQSKGAAVAASFGAIRNGESISSMITLARFNQVETTVVLDSGTHGPLVQVDGPCRDFPSTQRNLEPGHLRAGGAAAARQVHWWAAPSLVVA
jgi:hypothetical protein